VSAVAAVNLQGVVLARAGELFDELLPNRQLAMGATVDDFDVAKVDVPEEGDDAAGAAHDDRMAVEEQELRKAAGL
jgi:hypothetical protein